MQEKNYNKTLVACYLGFVTQAIAANFAPLLFLTFKGVYQVSLEQIALIPFTFYLTQLFVDLAATKYADKIPWPVLLIYYFIDHCKGDYSRMVNDWELSLLL